MEKPDRWAFEEAAVSKIAVDKSLVEERVIFLKIVKLRYIHLKVILAAFFDCTTNFILFPLYSV